MALNQHQSSLRLWLTPREAARARGLNERLVRRLIEKKYLPTSRPGGRYHLVLLADLDALLDAAKSLPQDGPLAGRG